MLIYSLLHHELRPAHERRQELPPAAHKTAATPSGHHPGVETTTGPLGQGITNAVGFALAEKAAGCRVRTATAAIVDHNTYAFLGDGFV